MHGRPISSVRFMHFIQRLFVIVMIMSLSAGMLIPHSAIVMAEDRTLVLTEVMANAIAEDTDEFIELYNPTDQPIDVAGFQLTDGDALDTIIAWDSLVHGMLRQSVVVNTTIIPARGFAVVLDSEYATGFQHYAFLASTIVFTTQNTTLGNGLTTTDAVTLYNKEGIAISTYGTPIGALRWEDRDDDGLDGIPWNPGDGVSSERIDAAIGDQESNWQASFDDSGSTPGALNSSKPEEPEAPEDDPDEDDGEQNPTSPPPNHPDSPDDADPPDESDAPDVPIGDATGDVQLSELLPNPEGSDDAEFIELRNNESHAVDVSGWVVSDLHRAYTIGSSEEKTMIPSHGYFVVERADSGIALNNTSKEQVQLRDGLGQVLDEVTYTKALENQSFAWVEHQWLWTTTVTRGKSNKGTSPSDDSDNEENNKDEQDNDNESEPSKHDSEAGNNGPETLRLSEVFPNPEGSDTAEWIEIENTGGTAVDLKDWTITDTKTFYRVRIEISIPAHGFYRLDRSASKIALNNSSDELFLITPDQDIVDGVYYTDVSEAQSFARVSSTAWSWTLSPTPGTSNTFTSSTEEDEQAISETSASASSKSRARTTPTSAKVDVTMQSIEQAVNASAGTKIIVEGIVNIEPGIENANVFYIQDDHFGIQIYAHRKEFPELHIGDHVRVTGERSEAKLTPRIKISIASDIQITGSGDVSPKPISASEELELYEGMRVTMAGTLIDREAGVWTVALSDGEVIVNPTSFTAEMGDTVSITGVVTRRASGFVIVATDVISTSHTDDSQDSTDPANANSEDQKDAGAILGVADENPPTSFWNTGWSHVVVPGILLLGFVFWNIWNHRRKWEVLVE